MTSGGEQSPPPVPCPACCVLRHPHELQSTVPNSLHLSLHLFVKKLIAILTYLLGQVVFHLRSAKEIPLKSLKVSQPPSTSPRKASWHSLTCSLTIQCRWHTADKHHVIPENIQYMPISEETVSLTHSLFSQISGKQQWHLLRKSQQLSSQGVKEVHADKVFPWTYVSPCSLNTKCREGLLLKLETRARVNLRLERNPTTSSPRDPCIPSIFLTLHRCSSPKGAKPLLPSLIFKSPWKAVKVSLTTCVLI